MITYVADTYRFGIVGDDELIAEIDRVLVDVRDGDRRGGNHADGSAVAAIDVRFVDGESVCVRFDGEMVYPALHVGSLVSHLLIEINRRVVHGASHVGFHAGAVSKANDSVLIVGASGSGKSTLTAALSASGWGFVADEVALVNGTSPMRYLKPIAVRPASIDLLASRIPSLSEPPGRCNADERFVLASSLPDLVQCGGGHPAPVTTVVFPTFTPAATDVRVDSLSSGEVLELLMRHALSTKASANARFRAAESIARTSGGYRLVYGDALDAVTTLETLVARPCATTDG